MELRLSEDTLKAQVAQVRDELKAIDLEIVQLEDRRRRLHVYHQGLRVMLGEEPREIGATFGAAARPRGTRSGAMSNAVRKAFEQTSEPLTIDDVVRVVEAEGVHPNGEIRRAVSITLANMKKGGAPLLKLGSGRWAWQRETHAQV